ncbi:unnamed protein product, partial [Nesidiocoris tenuis]
MFFGTAANSGLSSTPSSIGPILSGKTFPFLAPLDSAENKRNSSFFNELCS